jgi:small-conductance mechanosensitive channel
LQWAGKVRWNIIRVVKEHFDQTGISIPFPQWDIHVCHTTATSESTTSEKKNEKSQGLQAPDGNVKAV